MLQLTTAKECARQISELPKDEFRLLQIAFDHTHPTTSDHTHISTEEPVVVQLSTVLEDLACRDSGTVSDLESSTAPTELFGNGSSTHQTDEHAQLDQQKDTPTLMNELHTDAVERGDTNQMSAKNELANFVSDTLQENTSSEQDPPTPTATPTECETATVHSTEDIPVSTGITKMCRRVKQWTQTEQRRYTSPADRYQRPVRHSWGQSRGFQDGRRGGWRKGGGQRGWGHSKHTGVAWRSFPQPPVTYNHAEVASFLLKG